MLQVKNICKKYVTGDLEQVALDNVSLSFRDNEFVAVLGPSGSGKTTLLNIIGGLDRYDSGDLIINGVSTKEYKDRDWDAYRNHTIGFVFQSYNLIPHQSILQNVELALTISGVSSSERKQRAIDALTKVGLGEQVHKKPNQLSGGQMQRVAIARALVNNPDIILADEPTGALDTKTSIQIMDLLQEVAQDRLVIMVTHNPELAEQYATRIVKLRDGAIVSDTMPVEEQETVISERKPEKTKLGFLTALSLSLNNLKTKKSRTFLTAFAGSIGIIGIALILALSSGVNDYIENIESQMLGSYPVTLQQVSFDISSFMSGDMDIDTSNTAASKVASATSSDSSKNTKDSFSSSRVVGDSISATQSFMSENDLGSFKTYLDTHGDELKNDVTAVEYAYDIEPLAFRMDNGYGLVSVSPASLTLDSANTRVTSMMTSGLSSSWSQLVTNQSLREQQYSLLAGSWPKNYDEVALIINEDGTIDDYTLYTLGLMDISEMQDIVEAAENGKEFTEEEQEIKYDDALGKTYQVFAPAELYIKSEGVYIDKSEDEEYLSAHLKDGTNVKISCVLQAKEGAGIESGVGYTSELTKYLMKQTANTDVVKAQLASKDVNVMTGSAFSDEDQSDYNLFDSVSSIKGIFTEKESSDLASDELKTTYLGTYGNITPMPTETSFEIPEGTDFFSLDAWMQAIMKSAMSDEHVQEALSQIIESYIDSMSEEEMQALIAQYAGSMSQEDIEALAQKYIENLSEEDIQALAEQYIGSMSQEDIAAMAEQYLGNMSEEEINQLIQQYAGNIDSSMLQSYLADYLAQNGDELFASLKENMDTDQLAALVAQFTGSGATTYEGVLESLSYYTEDEPSSISIYPKTMEGKQSIENFINEYNAQCESDGQKVTYTDYIAAVTSSITKIVDVISYVLIAFVAISLIVSSIMIAIITYISVLERTKEIGVLRALGSSKSDISNIFNAETFIEGFFSGLLGVLITLLICIPVNAIVLAQYEVHNIAHLPLMAAIGLILISILLTLIAGFIPSRMAAKKDPVLALRSE